ncbi:MAG: 50S ribosomal protein L25 [Patescibacteria group bacterium]
MSTISVSKRSQIGAGLNKLRAQGILPAVVYGHKVEPAHISVDKNAFAKIYRQAGESTLIDLVIAGAKEVKVLIKEVQFHPITNQPIHIDFYKVSMDEKLTADIPLRFVGEPKAVKELGGILVRNIDHLKVECLPKDLVHEIEIDITGLAELEQSYHVKDIKLPPGLKLLTASEDIAVTILRPRTEAELEKDKGEVKEDISQVGKVEAEEEVSEENSADDKK